MKKDIKVLLGYLRDYNDSFYQSDSFIKSKIQDKKMNDKIDAIAKKHGLDF